MTKVSRLNATFYEKWRDTKLCFIMWRAGRILLHLGLLEFKLLKRFFIKKEVVMKAEHVVNSYSNEQMSLIFMICETIRSVRLN